GDAVAVPLLQQMAVAGPTPLGRVHALWTLDGLDALDSQTLLAATEDKDERIRATALHLCERRPPRKLLERLSVGANDSSPLIRLQSLLMLGSIKGRDTEQLTMRLLQDNDHYLFRAAAMTGLQGRELEFLSRLLAMSAWQTRTDHHRQMIC